MVIGFRWLQMASDGFRWLQSLYLQVRVERLTEFEARCLEPLATEGAGSTGVFESFWSGSSATAEVFRTLETFGIVWGTLEVAE